MLTIEPPWNKGRRSGSHKYCKICNIKFYIPPSRINTAKFCSKKCYSFYQTTISSAVKGKHYKLSVETKEKIRKSLIGRHCSEKTRIKIRKGNIGKIVSEETRLKISRAFKGKKHSKEHIRKCLRRNPKSSLEVKFEDIVSKHNLPYKFVGNGEVLIGRKCPDFINNNGQKIAVEVYYRSHKEKFRDGLENWKTERQRIFKDYGWEIEFFDETQVSENEILRRLG